MWVEIKTSRRKPLLHSLRVDSEDVDLNWNHWKRVFTEILDYHTTVVVVVFIKMPSPGLSGICKTHEKEKPVADAGWCECMVTAVCV